ncbi:hypothetical protein B0H16DRAFT_1454370 [Mycena metata]|uniref:Uncharacterized protein n=1 Tax=Mycena metata TaxID=1033252 RepID=A0AAD7NL08_9AGAR|nr:hypothetical protein B0H16DRAFT_1454370 [Mycena metata]
MAGPNDEMAPVLAAVVGNGVLVARLREVSSRVSTTEKHFLTFKTMSGIAERSVVVVVKGKAWLMIKNSRASSPIILPTCELATNGELTTSTRLTHAEKAAKEQAAEDLLLANNYFERIGRCQRIHEYAVHRHLKHTSKSTLRLVIETFNDLYASEMQVPPPLGSPDDNYDAKAAIARGRALAFTKGTVPAEHYDGEAVETAWADAVTNKVLATTEGGRRVHDDEVFPRSSGSAAPSLEEAKLAVEHIENITLRLLPKHECKFA